VTATQGRREKNRKDVATRQLRLLGRKRGMGVADRERKTRDGTDWAGKIEKKRGYDRGEDRRSSSSQRGRGVANRWTTAWNSNHPNLTKHAKIGKNKNWSARIKVA